MFFMQAVHCSGGRLQFSGAGLKLAWLAGTREVKLVVILIRTHSVCSTPAVCCASQCWCSSHPRAVCGVTQQAPACHDCLSPAVAWRPPPLTSFRSAAPAPSQCPSKHTRVDDQCDKLAVFLHLTALFRDYPSELVPERKNQSGFYWSNRKQVAMASAAPYASLHLAPDR